MKKTIVIFLILITSLSHAASPGKRRTKLERKKARVERQYARKQSLMDERSMAERKKDHQMLFMMLIGTSIVVGAMTRGE